MDVIQTLIHDSTGSQYCGPSIWRHYFCELTSSGMIVWLLNVRAHFQPSLLQLWRPPGWLQEDFQSSNATSDVVLCDLNTHVKHSPSPHLNLFLLTLNGLTLPSTLSTPRTVTQHNKAFRPQAVALVPAKTNRSSLSRGEVPVAAVKIFPHWFQYNTTESLV